MKTLTKFRRRSNKAQWIRQAILVGLAQDAEGQQIASDLLEHWTGQKLNQLTSQKQAPPACLAEMVYGNVPRRISGNFAGRSERQPLEISGITERFAEAI